MSDPKKLTISDFITKFKTVNTNLSSNKDILQTTGNNIKLIDDLLKAFMGTDEYTDEQINLLAKSSITPPLPSYNVRAPHVEVWINGALIIKPGQQDEPEFDVVNPNDTISLANIRPKLDVWFKDFSLDMAFGGPVGTIQGELKLFSRDPLDFLSFLYDFVSNVDEISGLPSVSLRFGWNIAHSNNQTNPTTLLSPKLDFLVTNVGMEDPSGQQQGSLFTLKLQDTGSAIYDNCAADFALKEDYPQQQLRILIERVMGVRLFTLDDLLSVNEDGDATNKAASNVTQYSYEELDPENTSQLIILTSLLQQLQQQEQNKTGNIVIGTREQNGIFIVGEPETATTAGFTSVSIPYLSNSSLGDLTRLLKITGSVPNNTATYALFKKDTDIVNYVYDTIKKYPGYMSDEGTTNTPVYGSNQLIFWTVLRDPITGTSSFKNPLPNWTIADSVNHMYLWFSEQSYASKDIRTATLHQILVDAATVAVNNYGFPPINLTDNLKKDIIKLFAQNSTKTPSQTIKEILDKYNQADPKNVKAILQTVYNQNPSLFTNTFFLNGQNPPLRLNSKSFRETITNLVSRIQCRWYPITNGTLVQNIAESQNASQDSYIKYNAWKKAVENNSPDAAKLQIDYEKAKVKKAYGCRLVYVSNFPKKYRTTSNTQYIDEKDMADGAFVLLPNINPLHITSDEMPLVYGPGGSRYPYLYGGAQNIKQVLLDKSGKLPQMFGEVIDAKVNYNNLTALIKANFNDDAAIAEAGTRISLNTTMRSGATISSPEQKKTDRETRKKILTEQLNRLYPKLKDKNPQEIQKYIEEAFEGKNGTFTEIRRDKNFRSYSTVYQGKRKMIKADANPSSDPINKTYNAPLDPQSSARDFLIQRLGNMMYSPVSISLQLMGDPFLIRQGIGAFELLHYFIDKEGIGLRYNYLLSGVFLVTSINHTISAGNYYTNIKAFKIPPVENTFTNTIDSWRKQTDKKDTIETGLRSYEVDTELTTALDDLMTKNINLDLLTAIENGLSISSATRITTGTVINTEVTNPEILNDVDKFYFDL